MTPEEKQDNILDVWQTHRPTILALQEHYREHGGRGGYFVGQPSHATLLDGETKAPVDMTVHPDGGRRSQLNAIFSILAIF